MCRRERKLARIEQDFLKKTTPPLGKGLKIAQSIGSNMQQSSTRNMMIYQWTKQPAYRMTGELLENYGRIFKDVAVDVSARMGFHWT